MKMEDIVPDFLKKTHSGTGGPRPIGSSLSLHSGSHLYTWLLWLLIGDALWLAEYTPSFLGKNQGGI